MIWHRLKITLRNIVKGRWMYLINVIGLSISLVVVILLSAYISGELNRGKSLSNGNEVFQVKRGESSSLSFPMIKMLREKIPGIDAVTGFHSVWADKKMLVVENSKYTCDDFLYADSLFFDVFNYKAVYGDLSSALSFSDGMVLTRSVSEKIFGTGNPVGKSILFKTTNDTFNLVVNAVIEDLPKEAIFKFDGLISKYSLKKVGWYANGLTHWGQCNYSVFARIKKNIPIPEFEERINTVFKETAPSWIQKDDGPFNMTMYEDLYFKNSGSWGDLVQHNSLSLIKVLGGIALIILIISWINYINLNTAQLSVNQHIYGIQKYLGASYLRLAIIGIMDSFPIVLIALIFSFLLMFFALPVFNYFLGASLELADLLSGENIIHILIILLVTIFVCGTIPVVIQQAYSRSKKRLTDNTPKSFVRNSLLVFQFCISIAFILSTIVMVRQSRFMQHASTGYYQDNIIYLDLLEQFREQREAFKEELQRIPGISDVAFASDVICNVNQFWGMSLDDHGEDKRVGYTALKVDANFFQFIGIQIIKGNGFRKNSIKKCEYIFNETAIKQFGIADIENARITSSGDNKGAIIGVAKNFKFKSMHSPISSFGFLCEDPKDLSYAYIKTNTSSAIQLKEVIQKIEETWHKFAKDWPMEYGFLDQSIQKMYEKDVRMNKAFIMAALISIFVACMGLLGVSIFTIGRRIKEIGIRKVNGARVSEILAMLNKDFVKWVVIAFVIATPIAWYAMHKWLENFAYKTTLSWWIFALAGVLALGITLLTVSWQSWRAATRNPVEALRYE